ncbi:MAG: NADH-quinone oxidoreductase subunit C [Candidatus Omnitrophota bacterium]
MKKLKQVNKILKMNKEEILQDLQTRFKDSIVNTIDKSQTRVYFEIKSQGLVKIATYIFNGLGARFNIASGVDCPHTIEILYHFTIEEINLVISLRAVLAKDKLEIDSLTRVFKGSNWIEREIHELLGVNFIGHPDLRRLLLPDEWPEGLYPLRRDYQEWDNGAIRDRGV